MEPTSAAADLYGTPTAAELVEAVREFLESDVLPVLEGSTSYQARVAINTLRIVQRELEAGGVDVTEHRARLADLGYADDAALAAAIRSGNEDGRRDLIKAAVTESVRAKLQVANPRYLKEIQ